MFTTTESMDHQLGWMAGIEVGVVERIGIKDVQLLGIVLRATCVEVEVDLWMRTPVGLLKARV